MDDLYSIICGEFLETEPPSEGIDKYGRPIQQFDKKEKGYMA